MAYSGIKSLNSNYGCSYYKNGNVVYVSADFGNKTVPQSGVTVGTLPSSYRPSLPAYVRNGFDNQSGQMTITAEGVVTLSSSSESFDYGHFTCSYPASTVFN